MRPNIWPFYDEETVKIVSDVLASGKVNYWTGSRGKEFERKFADFAQCKYGIAVANGTVSLELALEGIGIKPGDEVIVPSRSFFATASVVALRGAIPVFADVDLVNQNVTPETLKPHISKKTKAIIVVHLAGWPCDMNGIMALANQHNLYVIEDCAQAHGAQYQGKSVGSFGHVSSFSFCQDKIMSTGGEGGMVVTNDKTLYQHMWSHKDHGKNQSKCLNAKADTHFKWVHDAIGTNYRMTEMQAAIELRQLDLLPGWLSDRRSAAKTYTEAFRHIEGLRVSEPTDDSLHAYYKYYVFLDPEYYENPAQAKFHLLEKAKKGGVPLFYGSCPEIYKEGGFKHTNIHNQDRNKNAEALGDLSLMLNVDPSVNGGDQEKVIGFLKEAINEFKA